jgi:hypothetical protein
MKERTRDRICDGEGDDVAAAIIRSRSRRVWWWLQRKWGMRDLWCEEGRWETRFLVVWVYIYTNKLRDLHKCLVKNYYYSLLVSFAVIGGRENYSSSRQLRFRGIKTIWCTFSKKKNHLMLELTLKSD